MINSNIIKSILDTVKIKKPILKSNPKPNPIRPKIYAPISYWELSPAEKEHSGV